MKTEKELKAMMLDKRYSGKLSERDADFIREVEMGLQALHPVKRGRRMDESQIPDAIRQERDARRSQLINLGNCLGEEKARLVEMEAMQDRFEQAGNASKLRKFHADLESARIYIEILKSRIEAVSKVSAAANAVYQKALTATHPCAGCKHFTQRANDNLCVAQCQSGEPARPVESIGLDECPAKDGKDLDTELPIIHRPQFLPGSEG